MSRVALFSIEHIVSLATTLKTFNKLAAGGKRRARLNSRESHGGVKLNVNRFSAYVVWIVNTIIVYLCAME